MTYIYTLTGLQNPSYKSPLYTVCLSFLSFFLSVEHVALTVAFSPEDDSLMWSNLCVVQVASSNL